MPRPRTRRRFLPTKQLSRAAEVMPSMVVDETCPSLASWLVHDEGTAHPEPPPYVAAGTPSVLADASSCLRAEGVFVCPNGNLLHLGPPERSDAMSNHVKIFDTTL